MTAPARPPFVLVHGGRHGGWCWGRVAPLLRAAGHDVYTLSLTGLGDRVHLARPDIDLDTHILDVVNLIRYESLHDVVLVGHSYGGMVITGALEHVADHVRRVVFLDAHTPVAGESVFDLVGKEIEDMMTERARTDGDGWRVPVMDASFWGLTDPDEIAWINSKITPQPIRTYQQPIAATDAAWSHPGTYIECAPTRLAARETDRVKARVARDPSFRYRVLNSSHEPMVSIPQEVADLLVEAADLDA